MRYNDEIGILSRAVSSTAAGYLLLMLWELSVFHSRKIFGLFLLRPRRRRGGMARRTRRTYGTDCHQVPRVGSTAIRLIMTFTPLDNEMLMLASTIPAYLRNAMEVALLCGFCSSLCKVKDFKTIYSWQTSCERCEDCRTPQEARIAVSFFKIRKFLCLVVRCL